MSTNFLVIRFLTVITAACSLFVSCDDDISEVGANALIGSELEITSADFAVSTTQVDVEKPRINDLDYYLLGNSNQGFGNTQYGILSQIFSYSVLVQDSSTETTDEDGEITSTTEVKYELENIELVLPYHYSLSEDDDADSTDGLATYTIDSNTTGETLTLDVYFSGYELQATDPNIAGNVTESYYADNTEGNAFTDGTNSVNFSKIRGNKLASEIITLPTTGEIITVNTLDDDDEALSSEEISANFKAIRIELKDTNGEINFPELTGIIDSDGVVDITAFNDLSIFKIFQGIYIEATTASENSVTEILDFNQTFVNAGLKLTFSEVTTFTDLEDDTNSENNADDPETVITTLTFTGNPLNIMTYSEDSELTPTSEEIILQSGLGSIAKIDLFSDSDEFTELHDDNILLNDAVLRLTVNTDSDIAVNTSDLPENIFINIFETGSILADYTSNFSSTDEDNETLKEGHLMSLVIPDNDSLYPYYEINITEHLANILKQDSFNISDQNTLGISVTEDLNITNSTQLFPAKEETINQGSLLSFKTVSLFGSQATDIENRPRLFIKYTSTK